jgi:short-subunit dehydrogenase
MAVKLKPLNEQVMVITGASSGIGLATARAAARQGAKVVLVARNGDALKEIESKIQEGGGTAMYIVADVSKRDELQKVADTTIQHFGGFDTWVNNAGLSIWGRMEQVSDEDHQRLFDINFWGLVYGSFIAAEHLKSRGGAIINLGSVASDMVLPLQGMYCASKHAIKGFTDALRMELEAEGHPVSVTLIKPASINTPFPQHARNYMDSEPRLPDPAYPPEEVAHAILHAATRPQRDIYVGGSGPVMVTAQRLAPRVFDWLGETLFMNQQRRSEPPRSPAGALYHAGDDGEMHGDHPGLRTFTSAYTRAMTHPVVAGALVAAAGVAVAAALFSDTPRRRW